MSERTPGWPEGSMDHCTEWSPEQHRQVACDLLDSTYVPTQSEDAWDGEPPHRIYVARDPEDRESDPPDFAPYLAALTHALLAQAPTTPPDRTAVVEALEEVARRIDVEDPGEPPLGHKATPEHRAHRRAIKRASQIVHEYRQETAIPQPVARR